MSNVLSLVPFGFPAAPTRHRNDSARSQTEIIAADAQGKIWSWSLKSSEPPRFFTAHASSITAIKLHPAATTLFSAGFDGSIKVWEWPLRQELVSLFGHGNFVRSLSMTPDGKALFSASSDGTIRIWDGTPEPPGGT